jgi:hypothetical protein
MQPAQALRLQAALQVAGPRKPPTKLQQRTQSRDSWMARLRFDCGFYRHARRKTLG